jgi:hypothetical protein
MSGPPPKDADDRLRRNEPVKAVIEVVVTPAVDEGIVPDAPYGLRSYLIDEWHSFWLTPTARLVATTDLPALERLWTLREKQAQYLDELGALFAEGSKGQISANPALAAAMSLEKAIASLEDRFALTPKARQNAGIRMGALMDVAKRHGADDPLSQEPTPRADPRLADAQPVAPDARAVGSGLDGSGARPR